MAGYRDRLDFRTLGKTQCPVLCEDAVLPVAFYPSLRDLAALHQDVTFTETPPALNRRIHLGRGGAASQVLQLDLSVSWNGFGDALDLLGRFLESHQGPLPIGPTSATAEGGDGVGEFGLAWSWPPDRGPDVVCFVRHNVLVILQAFGGMDLLAVAGEIDGRLRNLGTVAAYTDSLEVFADLAAPGKGIPRVAPGGQLTIARVSEVNRHFFFATRGSVNRDPGKPGVRYYRAPLEPGRQVVTLYHVARDGIIPKRERLAIDIG